MNNFNFQQILEKRHLSITEMVQFDFSFNLQYYEKGKRHVQDRKKHQIIQINPCSAKIKLVHRTIPSVIC